MNKTFASFFARLIGYSMALILVVSGAWINKPAYASSPAPGHGPAKAVLNVPTPTPLPTNTPTATFTPTPSGPQYPLISEVFYDTPGTESSQEWIEIYNPTASAIDLSNYKLGDEETQGGGEGMYRFPAGASIAAGQKIVVALKSTGFFALYGFKPNYEVVNTDASVPNMSVYSAWATGTISLANGGDEVLLLNGSDSAVDVVTYGSGSYPGVTAHATIPANHSLERSPAYHDTNNCAVDFVDRNPPTPGN